MSSSTHILRIIHKNHEITRSELMKTTGLSAPTITRALDKLSKKGLVSMDDFGESIGGRRPQILKFQAKENYVIGVDIGGTYVRAALSNLDGEFSYEINLPTDREAGFAAVMDQAGDLIKKMEERALSRSFKILGVGIAVCGLVTKEKGMVAYSPIFGWKDEQVVSHLKKYTDLEIAIGNVSHLVALAESLYGHGKDFSDFVAVNLGYGISSGVIINNELFVGANGFAGELGHIIVDKYSSIKGKDTVNGTLEALSSGYAIRDAALASLKQGTKSSLQEISASKLEARHVLEHADKGDKLAVQLVDQAADYISIGIDVLVKLFNPQAVILSGGLTMSNDLLIEKISTYVHKMDLPLSAPPVSILKSKIAENPTLMGAFSIVLKKVLHTA